MVKFVVEAKIGILGIRTDSLTGRSTEIKVQISRKLAFKEEITHKNGK